MYLYYATKDQHLLEIGVDILESIEHSAKTDCGYATVSTISFNLFAISLFFHFNYFKIIY